VIKTTVLIGVSLTLIVDITKVPDFNKVRERPGKIRLQRTGLT
jgi:hypothetical protein